MKENYNLINGIDKIKFKGKILFVYSVTCSNTFKTKILSCVDSKGGKVEVTDEMEKFLEGKILMRQFT